MEPDFLQTMPEYQSHKIVRAAKVTGIDFTTGSASIGLVTEYGTAHIPLAKGVDYEEGGYLVRYVDGYLSYSPKTAFEEGYTAIEPA